MGSLARPWEDRCRSLLTDMKADQNPDVLLAKTLLMLCWYLERGTDFSSTTRSDMLETVVDTLAKIPASSGLFERALDLLADDYKTHPLKQDVLNSAREFLKAASEQTQSCD